MRLRQPACITYLCRSVKQPTGPHVASSGESEICARLSQIGNSPSTHKINIFSQKWPFAITLAFTVSFLNIG